MDQNNGNHQNGQGNIPDNPYTQYYSEYIVTLDKLDKDAVSKPRRIVSLVLCAVSSMLILCFCVFAAVMVYQYVNVNVSSSAGTAEYLFASIIYYIYFMAFSLAASIIAKIINRKSIWSVINFILMGVILAAVISLSFVVPGMARTKRSEKSNEVSAALNRDIKEVLADYRFDVEDIDGDYSYDLEGPYEVWIYVSSEASKKKIQKLDDFLEDIYDMESSRDYRVTFKINPVYFEPDDDNSLVYINAYEFQYNHLSPKPKTAHIDRHLNTVFEYSPRESGRVPEKLVKGNMLIVVR